MPKKINQISLLLEQCEKTWQSVCQVRHYKSQTKVHLWSVNDVYIYIYTYFVIIINHKQVWSLGLFRYGNQPSTIFIGFALAQRAKVPNLCGRPANNPRGRLNRRQRKGGVMIVEVHLVLARRLRRTTSWKFLPLWNWESRDKSKVKDDVLSTLSVQCPGYWIFW